MDKHCPPTQKHLPPLVYKVFRIKLELVVCWPTCSQAFSWNDLPWCCKKLEARQRSSISIDRASCVQLFGCGLHKEPKLLPLPLIQWWIAGESTDSTDVGFCWVKKELGCPSDSSQDF